MTKKRKQGERDRGPAGEKLVGPAPDAAAGGRATGVAAAGEGGKKEAPEKDVPRSRYDAIRENLEAFIVAVILALIIRHFVVEAFEIPTGSMATTLYGMHAWVDCPNCDTGYAVALASDSATGNVSVDYRSTVVYEGKCTNPNCSLDIHLAPARGAALRCAS
ncbi:MAG TPA: S26 family signal peptidase, partial [Candidatus Eisenbacteria bacterium]|nr:S26 family signal peptidase [Candidatus Eisenbacteria bacterium]